MREHAGQGTEVLDGLRGLAILLVMAFHSWLFSWYTPQLRAFGIQLPIDVLPRTGYLGVDLFFTISGFVLFLPYARRAVAGSYGAPHTLPAYAYRRAIKIVPSYAVALVATIPAVLSLPPVHGAGELAGTFVQHIAFVQNFFDDGFGQANSVFWSLAVEAQFYVIFPVVAWAFVRQPAASAAAMILAALVYRFTTATCCLLVQTVQRQLPAYLDLFAAGMLAAYAVAWLGARTAPSGRRAMLATFATAAFAAAVWPLLASANAVAYDLGGPQRWDLVNRSLLGLSTGGLAAAACFAFVWCRRAIANPVLVFFSLVSYNLYLWHTLVMIWMWKHGVPHATTPNPHDDDRWKLAFLAGGWATSIAIATAITYFIERPLLGTVRPHAFAFDWSRIARRRPSIATRETRT